MSGITGTVTMHTAVTYDVIENKTSIQVSKRDQWITLREIDVKFSKGKIKMMVPLGTTEFQDKKK